MWRPTLYCRTSGDLIHLGNDKIIGGYDWYIQNDMYDGKLPIPSLTRAVENANNIHSDTMPPWILDAREGKLFVGEALNLRSRIQKHNNPSEYSMNGSRDITYYFGYVGEVGDRIPSLAEMQKLSRAWKCDIENVINYINNNILDFAADRNCFNKLLKNKRDLYDENVQAHLAYGSSLWDVRAKQVMSGGKLDRPVIVNLKQINPDINLGKLITDIEIDGVKKKGNTPGNTLSQALETSSIGLWKEGRNSLGLSVAAVTAIMLAGAAVWSHDRHSNTEMRKSKKNHTDRVQKTRSSEWQHR